MPDFPTQIPWHPPMQWFEPIESFYDGQLLTIESCIPEIFGNPSTPGVNANGVAAAITALAAGGGAAAIAGTGGVATGVGTTSALGVGHFTYGAFNATVASGIASGGASGGAAAASLGTSLAIGGAVAAGVILVILASKYQKQKIEKLKQKNEETKRANVRQIDSAITKLSSDQKVISNGVLRRLTAEARVLFSPLIPATSLTGTQMYQVNRGNTLSKFESGDPNLFYPGAEFLLPVDVDQGVSLISDIPPSRETEILVGGLSQIGTGITIEESIKIIKNELSAPYTDTDRIIKEISRWQHIRDEDGKSRPDKVREFLREIERTGLLPILETEFQFEITDESYYEYHKALRNVWKKSFTPDEFSAFISGVLRCLEQEVGYDEALDNGLLFWLDPPRIANLLGETRISYDTKLQPTGELRVSLEIDSKPLVSPLDFNNLVFTKPFDNFAPVAVYFQTASNAIREENSQRTFLAIMPAANLMALEWEQFSKDVDFIHNVVEVAFPIVGGGSGAVLAVETALNLFSLFVEDFEDELAESDIGRRLIGVKEIYEAWSTFYDIADELPKAQKFLKDIKERVIEWRKTSAKNRQIREYADELIKNIEKAENKLDMPMVNARPENKKLIKTKSNKPKKFQKAYEKLKKSKGVRPIKG